MYEFFPLVAGILVALLARRLPTVGLRLATVVLLSTVFGAIATVISGEIFVSLAYLAFDIAQALLAAGVTTLLVVWLQRWRTPPLR